MLHAQIPTPQLQPAVPARATPPHDRRYLIPANYREVFTPSQIAAAETAMDLLITAAIRAERAAQAAPAQQ